MLHSSLHVSSEIPFSDSRPILFCILADFLRVSDAPEFPVYQRDPRISLFSILFFTLCYFQNSASTKKYSPHLQKTAIRRLPKSRKKLSRLLWKGRVLSDSLRLVLVRLPLSLSHFSRNSTRTSENLRLSSSHLLVSSLCRFEKSFSNSLSEPIFVLSLYTEGPISALRENHWKVVLR